MWGARGFFRRQLRHRVPNKQHSQQDIRARAHVRGLVEQNAAGAQWAIPTGIERGISVLDRIPVSIETRGGTSSTNL